MTCMQWDTLFSSVSNALENLPIARGDNSNGTALGYEIIRPDRLKMGRNNSRSLEGNGIDLEMSLNFTKILDRNRSIYQQWYQTFIDNIHLLNLRPNKWLKSDRLPLVDDIALFVFNDGNCSKESICWKLGKVLDVTGTKVTLRYSIKSRDDQVVVRSLRDFSIIYSVGEILSNTVKHFNKCCTSGWNPSQLGLGLPGLESGLGDKDDEGKVGGVLGEVEADSDEEEMTQVQMKRVL